MKTLFEMDDQSNSVSILMAKNGRKFEKIVSMGDFIESLIASKNKGVFEPVESPLYKNIEGVSLIQTKQIAKNSFIYVLKMDAARMPMIVYTRLHDDCGIPNLLYGIKVVNDKISQMWVVTTKDDVITETTKIYKYPFTNVSGNVGKVCLGANRFDKGVTIEDKIYQVPNQFFSMPNTMDSFSVNKNTRCFELEEMLIYLTRRDFDNDLLVANEIATYQDWFKAL